MNDGKMINKTYKKKSILISGYFGFGNCGDEAILEATVSSLKKYIPKVRIAVLSANPKETIKWNQVDSVHRLHLLSIIREMHKADFFISGGGGLLQDITGRGFSVLYYLTLTTLALILRKPAIIFAQGIGPIYNRFNKRLIKWVFNKVELIIVRDEKSKDLLRGFGIKKKEIYVRSDIALLLEKTDLPENIFKKFIDNESKSSDKKKMKVGIVLRRTRVIHKDYLNKVKLFAEVSDNLIQKHDANILFIPFQKHEDLPFIEDIMRSMKEKEAKYLQEEIRPSQMLELISGLSLLIGMRYHSILFAAMGHIPFIAINYDPKVEHLIHSLNLTELLVHPDQITIKNIDNQIKYIKVNRDKIAHLLETGYKSLQKKAQEGFRLLFECIERKKD